MRTIKILILCLPLFSISCSTEPKSTQLSEAPKITTVVPFEHVVFDYKNKYVYLEKNNRFGAPIKFTEVPNPSLK